MKTVESWLKQWLEIYVKLNKSPNTYECYYYIIELILREAPRYKEKDLEEVCEMEVQQFINRLSSKYSKSTLCKIRVIFHESYDAAVRNELCERNPFVSLSIPREASEKEVRGLTQSEQKLVEKAAHTDPLGFIIIFLLYTGLRSCELCNLKWSDYDEAQSVIYIRKSKTAAGVRVVPLLPTAKFIIDSMPHFCDYIFTSTTHNPVTPTVLKKLTKRIREKTGLDWITPHLFRHSFATRLVEQHVDYKALSVLLGHTNVAFTLHCYPTIEVKFLQEQIGLLNSTI